MPVLFGAKWGSSQQNGTPGGVVTWSLAEPGLSGVRRAYGTFRSDLTTDPEAVARYDVEREIRGAFAAWSAVADIDFVQVPDDGRPVGAGRGADIRVYFGQIDGVSGGTLAVAFFPFSQRDPRAGDLIVDASETAFYATRSNFRAVVIHEIGHTIGLDHITGVRAIMNPFVGRDSDLRPDDIEGARRIYGPDTDRAATIRVEDSPDLTVVSGPRNLRIIGDGRANALEGGAAAEKLIGRGGADDLSGFGGADTLLGGARRDLLSGGDGRDRLVGGGGNDQLDGGAAADTLVGGAGRDALAAGAGRDLLTGGQGADRFVFEARSGFNTVTDFTPDVDRIDFSGRSSILDPERIGIFDSDGGALVTDGTGTRILLEDVRAAELDLGDFLL